MVFGVVLVSWVLGGNFLDFFGLGDLIVFQFGAERRRLSEVESVNLNTENEMGIGVSFLRGGTA